MYLDVNVVTQASSWLGCLFIICCLHVSADSELLEQVLHILGRNLRGWLRYPSVCRLVAAEQAEGLKTPPVRMPSGAVLYL